MKLVLSIDLLDERRALEVAAQAEPFFDMVEIGTSLLKLSGVGVVERMRQRCSGKPVFVDSKIIDGPEKEAKLMCQSGASMFSMLACASDQAVSTVLEIADQAGVDVMFDMQRVVDYEGRCVRLKTLGARYLCVHKNPDCGENLVSGFREYLAIQRLSGLSMAIAGGVNLEALAQVKPILAPEMVIIGKAVTMAPDVAMAARAFREMVGSI
jgi:3-keto-L-gulonate-6-phosphate decarboxylase